MKSPAFQWYAADYLADERVLFISLAAEGAYIRLLSYCWREGSIPNNLTQLAAMCKGADPKTLKEVMPLFTKQGAPPGRMVHKRLEEERVKQEEYRARQSAKGAKGGRPRKDDEKPEKAGALPGLNTGLDSVKPEKSSISSTSSSITSDDVTPPAEAVKANPAKALAVATTDPDEEQHWKAGPLTKPTAFRVICERLGFLEIDFEHYRKQALVAAEDANVSRTIAQWTSWIRNYLNNQTAKGPLLKAAVVDLSRPTPKYELPPEGSDCTGRHIVLPNTGDANLNRVAAQTYAKSFPNAIILHTRP
jgi:uncharacterized protein YdaU (DUF1376 family)